MADVLDQIRDLVQSASVQDAEKRIATLEKEIGTLVSRAQALRAEIQTLNAFIDFKSKLGDLDRNGVVVERPALRQAIRSFMNQWPPGTPMRLGMVRQGLVERDWLGDTDSEAQRLQVAMSDLVDRKELLKPSWGNYALPHASTEAEEGGD
jgi:hypothetical protein